MQLAPQTAIKNEVVLVFDLNPSFHTLLMKNENV